jgi:phenylacetate-CoA ligase
MSTTADQQAWTAVERLQRPELEALQLEKLREQVRRLETNPYHGARFRAAGVDAESLGSLDDLRRFPFMSKQDVLEDTAEAPPYGRRLGINAAEIREIVTSGGTAGRQPEVYAFTRADLDTAVDLYAYDQHLKGARAGDVGMMVSEIGMLTSPPLNVRAWERLGMPVLRVGPNSTEERVATFVRFKPAVLKLPYVYAFRFVEACRAAGVDPKRDVPGLKFVFISGGAYRPEFAQAMEEFFGAPMHEVFGCSQAGTVTCGTCERGVLPRGERGWMHNYEHEILTEVLDPATGRPVRDGDEGELVITPLSRSASPVFRYRMGDRVRFGAAGRCGCGRPFTTIECGTIARYDDMLRIKGVNCWVHELDALILADPDVDEFNGLLTLDEQGRERVRVLVELRTHATLPRKQEQVVVALAAKLKDAFRVSFDVEAVPAGTVRRFELKQRRWTDQRAARLARSGP